MRWFLFAERRVCRLNTATESDEKKFNANDRRMSRTEKLLVRWRLYCVLNSLLQLVVALCLFGLCCDAADSWPSLHHGGNTSIDATGLPVTWSPRDITWQVELPGYGQSSPVVWNGLVYVTSIEGDNKERCHILALEASTGKIAWNYEINASISQKYGEMISRAAPTPVVDKAGVYVFYESGDFVALTHDGKKRWQFSLFDESANAFQNNHGYGASPTQTDKDLLILVDHKGPSYLLAVSKEDGKERWRTNRTSRTSWSSPQVIRLDERQQIIVSSGGTVDGYDAESGNQLWTLDGLAGNTIPSATTAGDLIFVGASQARGGSSSSASNCCLRLLRGEVPYELVWRAEKAACSYVSPLFHSGHVYYVNNVGVVYCLEASSGRQLYAERIDGPCWAQPIGVGDCIYFFCKKGVTTVLRSGDTFERVASNHLWDENSPFHTGPIKPVTNGDEKQESLDPVVYAVVAVDDAFFVRLGKHVLRISGQPIDSRLLPRTGQ